MPFNMPTSKTRNFTYGTGLLYLGATGTTPSEEVGIIKSGANLAIAREMITMEAGSPLQVIDKKVIRESAIFSFTAVEWDFKNLIRALGAGECQTGVATYASPAAGECQIVDWGGDMNVQDYALYFIHRLPSGDTIRVKLWKVLPNGELTLTFNEDSYQEFPYAFTAKRAVCNWSSDALPTKGQLYEIRREFSGT